MNILICFIMELICTVTVQTRYTPEELAASVEVEDYA